MDKINIRADKIGKSFEWNKFIFRGLDLQVQNGNLLAITGKNGSGKSTLLKMLAGALSVSEGKINLDINGKKTEPGAAQRYFGFVAPYLNLYDEFNPKQLLKIFSKMRNVKFDESKVDELLMRFGILPNKEHQIRLFSSGMKQRLKFVLALSHFPSVLFLDEPGTNLDDEGKHLLKETVTGFTDKGGAVIIATNEPEEAALCKKMINLPYHKK